MEGRFPGVVAGLVERPVIRGTDFDRIRAAFQESRTAAGDAQFVQRVATVNMNNGFGADLSGGFE